jgi:hypothetical protein
VQIAGIGHVQSGKTKVGQRGLLPSFTGFGAGLYSQLKSIEETIEVVTATNAAFILVAASITPSSSPMREAAIIKLSRELNSTPAARQSLRE